MFDAGAAVFTLTGRVVRTPFEEYGKLTEGARVNKEHMMVLGAKTEAVGFEKFRTAVDGVDKRVQAFRAQADGAFGSVGAYITKMATGASEDFTVIRGEIGKTTEQLSLFGDSAKATATVVSDEERRMQAAFARSAEEKKASVDAQVRQNEKLAESERAAAGGGGGRGGRNYVNPAGGAGGNPEAQAARADASLKKSFSTLTTLGKWTTVGAGLVGVVAVKWAADFQRQMELIHTQAGYTQKDVQHLRKEVLDLAPAVGVGPTELAKGLYHVTSVLQGQGGTVQAMNILKLAAEGAKVGMADMEDVSSALMAIWKSQPRDIHSVAEAMGVMNDIVGAGNLRMEDLSKALSTGVVAAAKNAHLGLRDLGAALDTMTSRGIPAEQAATRLRTTLTLMAAPTGKAAKALQEIGIAHDQLASDMEKHGLTYTLQDIQAHLDKAFPPGRKLTLDQQRQALMQYGKQLEESGVHGKSLQTALQGFDNKLKGTGSSAVQQSQLITEAFGGSRMGTTMALLMQNADDVGKRFNNLNKANAAGRFQKAWKDTQKDFSVQVSEMWAGVQKLGIQLGDWLIPKITKLVHALSQAAKWLGHHKTIATALAVVFGTLLTAAVVAFFGKLIFNAGKSLVEIGKFGKYLMVDLPKQVGEGASKVTSRLGRIIETLRGVQGEAAAAGGALDSMGSGMKGGPGHGGGGVPGAVEQEAMGAIEGMITGVRGTTAPGSGENPLAVVVMASESFGLGARGAAGEAKTAGTVESKVAQAESNVGGVGRGAGAAEEAVVAEEAAGGAGGLKGLLGKAGGAAKGLLGAAGEAVMPVAIGTGVGGIAQSALGLRGGGIASMGGGIAGGAIGMAIGGPIGAGIGSALGSTLGPTVVHAFDSIFGSPDFGKEATKNLSKGLGGPNAKQFQASIASLLDQGKKAADTTIRGQDYAKAGQKIAQQLEAGWNQYKFQDEPTMFKQLKTQLKNLPPFAQGAASQSAIQFAQQLEKEGRLPAGSAAKMLKQVEAEFPSFGKYLGISANASIKTFNAALDFKATRAKTHTQLNQIAGDFPTVSAAMKKAGGTVEDQSAAAVVALQDIIKHGTGPMRKQAQADLDALQATTAKDFQAMSALVNSNMADIAKQAKKGSEQAAKDATTGFGKFYDAVNSAMANGSLETSKGMNMIATATDQLIKEFGGNRIPIPALIHSQQLQRAFSLGKTGVAGVLSGSATGGYLPGGEFGHGDVMTLIDPMGIPRAKMAGDEGIFNRHQMPYVDAGLRALGIGGVEGLWGSVTAPHGVGFQGGGRLPSFAAGGYLFPFPSSVRIGRTDQGIDANMPVGSAIGPMGNAMVEGIIPNWYAGQPFIWWKLLDGPRAGSYGYVSEQINIKAHPGQIVKANQAVATYAPSGTGIEYGWATASGQTLAQVTGGYTEGEATAAGKNMRAFLTGLSHGKITGGALGGGGGAWTDIQAPRVGGKGLLSQLINASFKRATDAANKYGQSQAGSMTGAGWSGGGSNQANEQLGRRMMLAAGWGADQWPYLQKLWTQESGWSSTADNPSSGAYGIPQSLPANKMASAGSDWHSNPATQIAWGLNYIRSTYGSPQKAWGHEVSHNWYGSGGQLPSFRSGNKGWAPLPSSVGTLPGYRPPRVRRGASGFHTVGNRRSTGRAGGSRGGGSRGSSRAGRGKSQTRAKQPLTQTTADTLDKLGFGNFVADQNELGKLDTLFTQQQNLFSIFDTGGGMPLEDLDVLMGIKEEEWDILYKEFVTLPAAIARLQKRVDRDEGTVGSPGHYVTVKGKHPARGKKGKSHKPTHHKAKRKWIPPTLPSGVLGVTKEVSETEADIAALEQQSTAASHQITRIHHGVSGEIMHLADQYASESARYLDFLNRVHGQLTKNARTRIGIHKQMRSLAKHRSSGPDLSSIVSSIMSDSPLPATSALAHNPQYIHYQNQISDLQNADLTLRQNSYDVRQELHTLLTARQADARAYKEQGFDAAWSETLKKWKIQAKIAQLKRMLAQEKAALKEESAVLKADQGALQTLQNWESGGLQGTEAISSSLETAIYDILGLYQQGAALPTGGMDYYGKPRSQVGPTLSLLEQVLSGPPPKGLGMTLPAGLVQGTLAATQAAAEFASFQASRAALFSQFGSNFAPAGVGVGSSTAAIGAGPQFWGAAAGPEAGLGAPGGTAPGFSRGGALSSPGPGGTTLNIENHFAAGPPDPHTWSAGVSHEIGAMA